MDRPKEDGVAVQAGRHVASNPGMEQCSLIQLEVVSATHQATKKLGCVSLFTGVAGLELGLRGHPCLVLACEDDFLSRALILNREILKAAAVI